MWFLSPSTKYVVFILQVINSALMLIATCIFWYSQFNKDKAYSLAIPSVKSVLQYESSSVLPRAVGGGANGTS